MTDDDPTPDRGSPTNDDPVHDDDLEPDDSIPDDDSVLDGDSVADAVPEERSDVTADGDDPDESKEIPTHLHPTLHVFVLIVLAAAIAVTGWAVEYTDGPEWVYPMTSQLTVYVLLAAISIGIAGVIHFTYVDPRDGLFAK